MRIPINVRGLKIPLTLIWVGTILVLIGIIAGLEISAHNKQVATQPINNSSKKETPLSDSTAPINTDSSNTPTNNSNNSNSAVSAPEKTKSTPTTPTTSSNTVGTPPTLPGCTYINGPKSGQNCPATAPSSYSFSNYYPYSCYYTNPPNGSAPGPDSCPPYANVISIEGVYSSDYNSGYCKFVYSTYNGISGIYKSDRINNYGSGSIPDCSTATLYY